MNKIKAEDIYRKAREEWLRSWSSERIIEELGYIDKLLEGEDIYNSILLDDLDDIHSILKDECVKRFKANFS